MKSKTSIERAGDIVGTISIIIPSMALILVLNWLFNLTRFQQFQGIFILTAPFAAVVGFALAIVSARLSAGKLAKWGIIINTITFALPFIYWIFGTLIFGA